MERGWNTQFYTNCGRLPTAFHAGKRSGVCRRSVLRYFVSENPLMRDGMDKEQKKSRCTLCTPGRQKTGKSISALPNGQSFLLSLEITNDIFRNCFNSGSISNEVRLARRPAALFPLSSWERASRKKSAVLCSNCSINSLISIINVLLLYIDSNVTCSF